mmetsp:Transcript_135/g.294  ORF Transcript_135/g.294 Transcript_135/m.294 type:complete len:333 (+) Transcript_135:467-1465(+)
MHRRQRSIDGHIRQYLQRIVHGGHHRLGLENLFLQQGQHDIDEAGHLGLLLLQNVAASSVENVGAAQVSPLFVLVHDLPEARERFVPISPHIKLFESVDGGLFALLGRLGLYGILGRRYGLFGRGGRRGGLLFGGRGRILGGLVGGARGPALPPSLLLFVSAPLLQQRRERSPRGPPATLSVGHPCQTGLAAALASHAHPRQAALAGVAFHGSRFNGGPSIGVGFNVGGAASVEGAGGGHVAERAGGVVAGHASVVARFGLFGGHLLVYLFDGFGFFDFAAFHPSLASHLHEILEHELGPTGDDGGSGTVGQIVNDGPSIFQLFMGIGFLGR